MKVVGLFTDFIFLTIYFPYENLKLFSGKDEFMFFFVLVCFTVYALRV